MFVECFFLCSETVLEMFLNSAIFPLSSGRETGKGSGFLLPLCSLPLPLWIHKANRLCAAKVFVSELSCHHVDNSDKFRPEVCGPGSVSGLDLSGSV